MNDLWLAYFSVGGNHDLRHLAANLASDGHEIDLAHHDYIIAALNYVYTDRGLDHPLDFGPRVSATRRGD